MKEQLQTTADSNSESKLPPCPCETCITKVMCRERPLNHLLRECPYLRSHLVKKESGRDIRLWEDRFYHFCEIMRVKTRKAHNKVVLEYE